MNSPLKIEIDIVPLKNAFSVHSTLQAERDALQREQLKASGDLDALVRATDPADRKGIEKINIERTRQELFPSKLAELDGKLKDAEGQIAAALQSVGPVIAGLERTTRASLAEKLESDLRVIVGNNDDHFIQETVRAILEHSNDLRRLETLHRRYGSLSVQLGQHGDLVKVAERALQELS